MENRNLIFNLFANILHISNENQISKTPIFPSSQLLRKNPQ